MRTRCFSAFASLALVCAAAHADSYTLFDNEVTFTAALGGSLTRTNELNALEPGNVLHPVIWTHSGLACSIVSEPLLSLYALTNALSTETPSVRIVVRFTSNNVRAAGGLVYLTDVEGRPVAGALEVRVPGGPTIPVISSGGPVPFTGVISRGPLLTNLTLVSLVTNAYVTLDHLVVAEGQPALHLTDRGEGSLMVSWPAPATGYVLDRRALPTGSPWTAVSGLAVRTNDCWQLSVPAPGEGALFRLRKP